MGDNIRYYGMNVGRSTCECISPLEPEWFKQNKGIPVSNERLVVENKCIIAYWHHWGFNVIVHALCILYPGIGNSALFFLFFLSIRFFWVAFWTSAASGLRVALLFALVLVVAILVVAGISGFSFASAASLVQMGIPIVFHFIIRATGKSTSNKWPSTRKNNNGCTVW